MKERGKFAHSPVLGQGQIELNADAVFNLPIIGPSNFSRYANEEENVFTCCARKPRLVKADLEFKSRQRGRLSRLGEESIYEIEAHPPPIEKGFGFDTYCYPSVWRVSLFSPPGYVSKSL